MPIPSRATLKSYFETADQPTQAQFAALIDAIYDMNVDIAAVADAAAADAAAALAKAADVIDMRASFHCLIPANYQDNGVAFTLEDSLNIASVATLVSGGHAIATFTAPFADTYFSVRATILDAAAPKPCILDLVTGVPETKGTSACTFTLGAGLAGKRLWVFFFY